MKTSNLAGNTIALVVGLLGLISILICIFIVLAIPYMLYLLWCN